MWLQLWSSHTDVSAAAHVQRARMFSDVVVSDRAKMRKPCVGHPALPVQRLKRWLPSHRPHGHARSSPQPTVNITSKPLPYPRFQQKSPVSPAPNTATALTIYHTAQKHLQPRDQNTLAFRELHPKYQRRPSPGLGLQVCRKFMFHYIFTWLPG